MYWQDTALCCISKQLTTQGYKVIRQFIQISSPARRNVKCKVYGATVNVRSVIFLHFSLLVDFVDIFCKTFWTGADGKNTSRYRGSANKDLLMLMSWPLPQGRRITLTWCTIQKQRQPLRQHSECIICVSNKPHNIGKARLNLG